MAVLYGSGVPVFPGPPARGTALGAAVGSIPPEAALDVGREAALAAACAVPAAFEKAALYQEYGCAESFRPVEAYIDYT